MSEPQARMAESEARPRHRHVVERVAVRGRLVLESPASFGNGDAATWTDLPLLLDETDGSPLLTGASIAGALRAYLRERLLGYEQSAPELSAGQEAYEAAAKSERGLLATKLFGGFSGDEKGGQSALVVHDARGRLSDYELRDGVKIDGERRTAEEKKKFDIELLAAGTEFDLRFDLSLSDEQPDEKRQAILSALAAVLDGLARGEITLGARKRRGFGRCRVHEWRVRRYDLMRREHLLAWLAEGRESEAKPWPESEAVKENASPRIAEALGVEPSAVDDRRRRFNVSATFALDGSLLVRSGFGEADTGADTVQLHALRVDERGQTRNRPVLPGTSWAGVLRSRALQIANTIAGGEREHLTAGQEKKVAELIEAIFGPGEIKSKEDRQKEKLPPPWSSRLEVADSEIVNGINLRQTRVRIDRFTGGASESALFTEQPLWGGGDSSTRLTLNLTLRLPERMREQHDAAIGLLLLLLKDLWTGDLPLGGEVGVGRGRLRGLSAELNHLDGESVGKWTLTRTTEGKLQMEGQADELDEFVRALRQVLEEESDG